MTASWDVVSAEFAAGAQRPSQLPPPLGVELAFAGRSNVGKSSLMNAMMRRRNLVRTSATPGCTRQINFFEVRCRDEAVLRLVDLPGFGYAKRAKSERAAWAELIETYLSMREVLRAVVILVDARRGLEEEEAELVEFLRARPAGPVEPIVVATKVDKLKKSRKKAALAAIRSGAGVGVIGVSAVSGEGIERLWRALREAAHIGAEAEGVGASAPTP